jgi:hypothetical protein
MEVYMFHEEAHRRWREMNGAKKGLVIAGWIVVVAAVLALVGLVVTLLWNRIMSGVLGLPALGFWEGIGLFILAKILFGGRGGSFMGRMRMRRAMRERMAKQAESDDGSVD